MYILNTLICLLLKPQSHSNHKWGLHIPISWWHTFEDSPYSLRNVFQAIYKDEYDRINELSYFKCSLASGINKLRDTAIELPSKYTFFKTWNSLQIYNGSLNYSLISWFFLSLKNHRVTLKETNHPVITSITWGKTLKLISPKCQDWIPYSKHWLLPSIP